MNRWIIIVLNIVLFICPQGTRAQDIKRFEETTIHVAESVGRSVVSISATVKQRVLRRFYSNSPYGNFEDEFFQRFFEEFFGGMPEQEGRVSLGSGVIIDKAGYILTNGHVVNGADKIKVTLSDGRDFNAVIKGIDARTDLAVIKINASDLEAVELGDSDTLKIGQFVFALGNPFGISTEYVNPEPTVTMGVISALHRYIPAIQGRSAFEDMIQTDAAINPGNSGGPLVNLEGKVIGINTAIITRSGGYEGIGFAVPVNKAKKVLGRLIRGEQVLYGWLGVSIQNLNQDLRNYFGVKEKEGVIVVKVFQNSPAEKELREGDLILEFNGVAVKNSRELVSLVSSAEIGSLASLRILRSGSEMTVNVKIGARESGAVALEPVEMTVFRGLEVEDLTPFLRQRFNVREEQGVIIVNITENSPADNAGLVVGDVIVRVDNKRIRNKLDFEKATLNIEGECLIKTHRGYFVLKED